MAKGGLQKAVVLKDDLPPLSIFSDGSIGHYVRYRVVSEDKNRYSSWSPTYEVKVPGFDYLGVVDVNISGNSIVAVWGDEYNRPRYDVFVRWGNTVKKVTITADAGSSPATSTVKMEMHQAHSFAAGDTITVSVANQQTLVNGDFVVDSVSEQGGQYFIFYKIPGLNNTGTAVPTSGEITTRYTYHGTPAVHTYSMLKLPLYEVIHIDVQVEGIEKVYSQDLLIYDSPSVPLS